MKKTLIITFLIGSLLFVGGCGSQSKYEETMREYATTFYNNYQKGSEGLTTPTISIQQLKDANEQVQAGFDLTSLEKCTDDSYVELVIDEATKDVQDVKFFLQCE